VYLYLNEQCHANTCTNMYCNQCTIYYLTVRLAMIYICGCNFRKSISLYLKHSPPNTVPAARACLTLIAACTYWEKPGTGMVKSLVTLINHGRAG